MNKSLESQLQALIAAQAQSTLTDTVPADAKTAEFELVMKGTVTDHYSLNTNEKSRNFGKKSDYIDQHVTEVTLKVGDVVHTGDDAKKHLNRNTRDIPVLARDFNSLLIQPAKPVEIPADLSKLKKADLEALIKALAGK